jgi:hypothetical protein
MVLKKTLVVAANVSGDPNATVNSGQQELYKLLIDNNLTISVC